MSASREKRKRREERAQEVNTGSVKKTKGLSEKGKSVLTSVVSAVIVVAILVVIIGNSGIIPQKAAALAVGSEKISASSFNYYYKDAYANFVNTYSDYISYFFDTSTPLDEQTYSDDMTWADYFIDQAQATAKQAEILCAAAKDAGFTLSEEDAASIDSQIEYLESYAPSMGYASLKSYLITYYGKGCNEASYRDYLETRYIASAYANEKFDSFTYADDQLGEYYEENKDTLDTVTYRAFAVAAATAEEDDTDFDADAALADAKSIADSMASQSQGNEQAFIDLALENAPESNKEYYEDSDATLAKNVTSSNAGTFSEWLFDAERVEGETTVIENGTTGYYVVMFLGRSANDYETVNVRHILIQPESDDDSATEYTDEQWAAAEAKAQELYEQWQNGDATEDSFSELAVSNSTDTGSASEGGLYEGVYKGQMVTEFEDWCFDESRQVGDTGIVKTSYGYHIMYYVGTGDMYWRTLADNGLRNADYDSWYTDFSANYNVSAKSFGMFFVNK